MVAKFSVATDEGYRDNSGNWVDRTEWHDVVAWRGLAERAQNTLKKGMLVFVEGKLSTRKWQDQNGQDRYRTEVVANYFRILNSRGLEGEGNDQDLSRPDASTPVGEVPDSADDDLPF